jgi:hypothetical protein
MSDERKDLLSGEPVVINIGLPEFSESVVAQSATAIHVEWRPPATSDEALIELLDELL